MEENVGMLLKLPGITVAIICGFPLIVISSNFAHPKLYETTGIKVCYVEVRPKWIVFYQKGRITCRGIQAMHQ